VLRLEASSSHQERTCEVSIAVESEGDNTQRSSTIDADVKAPKAAEDASEEEDQQTSSSNDVGDMPWVGAHEVLLAVLIGALLIRRPE
jgi:F0F1-type ATP synthase assembly protein I